jgi:uncharacterized membrane protein
MEIFEPILLLATFLCSLVAGFLFAFAIVVMPGIKSLTDGEFIRSFQVMDRLIQNNQPVFLLVWVGSAVTLVAAFALGFARLDGASFALMTVCMITYILGVQAPTLIVNIPLNNELQALDLSNADEPAQQQARQKFESRWNRANNVRTCISCLVAALLMYLLLRL